jgi:hypothetical protein
MQQKPSFIFLYFPEWIFKTRKVFPLSCNKIYWIIKLKQRRILRSHSPYITSSCLSSSKLECVTKGIGTTEKKERGKHLSVVIQNLIRGKLLQ